MRHTPLHERLYLLLPITASLFSFHFHRSWLFGVYSFYSLINVFILTTVVILTHSSLSWRRICAAAASCIAASFSLIHGWLAWLIALPLLLHKSTKNLVPLVLVWFGLMAASMSLWFLEPNNIFLEVARKTSNAPLAPLTVFQIIFAILGHPLTTESNPILTLFVGIVLTTVFSYISFRLYRSQEYRNFALPWICLGLYAIGTAIVIGMGRVHIPQRAMAYHYMIPSQYLAIATIVLLCAPLLQYPNMIQRSILVVSTVWLVTLSALYLPQMERLSSQNQRAYNCALAYEQQEQRCFSSIVSAIALEIMYSVRDNVIRAGLFPPLRPPNTP